MADYAGQANAIYDPQYAASKGTLDATHAATLSSYDTEQKSINPIYDRSESNLKEARNAEGDRQDFLYSNALGGNTSGLLGNEQRVLGEHYMQNVQDLESERALKLGDVASRISNEDTMYGANVNALGQTINSSKAQYIAAGTQNDAAVAEQEKMQEQNAALQREIANNANNTQLSIARSQTPVQKSTNQLLSGYFAGYKPAKQGGQAFYTEQSVIPQLMADTGMDYNSAKSAAYNYRKQVFGE